MHIRSIKCCQWPTLKALLLACIALNISPLAAQTFTESNLPILLIDTENGISIVDEPKRPARLRIIANGSGQINRITDTNYALDHRIGIETRGQTSQLFSDKKPYAFEPIDANNEEVDLRILGMPKESDWVLLAPYSDKSLLRDVAAFELGNRCSNLPYTPRTRVVEVMVNNDYKGVYILTEKIKRDNDRVNVQRNVPLQDVTGGYIIKIDKGNGIVGNESWASHIASANGGQINFLYHYPQPEDISSAQMSYIQNYMRQFEDVLRGPDFQDPNIGIRKYADLNSFIDYMLHTEITRNVDGYRISTFLYKDRDSIDARIHMGPVWDFNIALGNANYCDGGNVTGWAWNFNQVCPSDYWFVPFWWDRLRQDSNYIKDTKARWAELRATRLSNTAINAMYDSLSALVADGPASRNFQRWGIMGVWQWPNNFVGSSWQSEADYLRRWTLDRMAWMDANIPMLKVYTPNTPSTQFQPRVQPNPARRGEIQFELSVPKDTRYTIQMYDQMGRLVIDTASTTIFGGTNTYTLKHSLSPGTYSWRVAYPNQNPTTGQVVILE
jgi:hypothetical protein